MSESEARHMREMQETEARHARDMQLVQLASRVGMELVGLDVDAATEQVAKYPELSVRFANGGPVTADLRPGRITALTQDGAVVFTSAG